MVKKTLKKIQHTLSRVGYSSIAALGIAVLLFLSSLFLNFPTDLLPHVEAVKNAPSSLQKFATTIVQKCSTVSYKPTCYEEEIPKLMGKISMEDAFSVTKYVQEQDPSYAYCHVLGHKLASNEVAKDPNKWKEVIMRCPMGVCSNGCIHGAFQERFRKESLTPDQIVTYKPELQDICEPHETWQPTQLGQGTCYHALGHLLMYITNADVPQSNQLCRDLAIKPEKNENFSGLCYDGVFMQIFQPLGPDDTALVQGKQPTLQQVPGYCDAYSGGERVSCWDEAWPMYYQKVITPTGLVDFCSHDFLKTTEDQAHCYLDMFYVITAEFQLDTNRVTKFCNGLPLGDKQNLVGQCFGDAASRLIETDSKNINKAIALCGSVNDARSKEYCFTQLESSAHYDFHDGSEEMASFCAMLPEDRSQGCIKTH